MPTRRRRLVLVLSAALLCACGGSAKRALIEDALEQSAPRVAAGDRARIARAMIAAEADHGVDALLLFAVAERESRFDARAKGRRGSLGIMQLRPSTARDVAKRHDVRLRDDRDLYDIETNVRLGAAYLAELKARFDSWETALTAYNRGPTAVRRKKARGEKTTSRYATRILTRHRKLLAEFDPSEARTAG